MVQKNGLGDLQKGERCVSCYPTRIFIQSLITVLCRYANMDFILFSSLVGTVITFLIFSYDIVCQWSRNLRQRHRQLPSWMQLPEQALNVMKFVIPKFHIYSHDVRCQAKYSLNFLKFSVRTNGEEPKRWWAHINPVSMSTREMGPGSRHDTIDDHAASWNWHKITKLGTCWF